jgi:hypothetical protein
MLIGHLGLTFTNDFYPEDLPKNWQFDYYCNEFNALFLDNLANIDMDELLDDIEDGFCLVLKLSTESIKFSHPNIVFFSSCSNTQDALSLLKKTDNICIQSDEKLDINLQFVKVENQFLYFNKQAVFITTVNNNDKQLAQQFKKLPEDICVIFQKTNSIYLEKAKTISELLNL